MTDFKSLNEELVKTHLENIKNGVFNENNIIHFLFDDGEVVTESRGEFWTQIPPTFYGYTPLSFVIEGQKCDKVFLTMSQAHKFREIINKLRNA